MQNRVKFSTEIVVSSAAISLSANQSLPFLISVSPSISECWPSSISSHIVSPNHSYPCLPNHSKFVRHMSLSNAITTPKMISRIADYPHHYCAGYNFFVSNSVIALGDSSETTVSLRYSYSTYYDAVLMWQFPR
jgi:hypothetical protein